MLNYKELKEKWMETLHLLEKTGCSFQPVVCESPATLQEIKQIEQRLNRTLPPSYREFLLTTSKHVSFTWCLPEEVMESVPSEFGEIYAGEIMFDMAELEDLTAYADEWYEDGIDYGVGWWNKLSFTSTGNGDFYAFDMTAEGEEKPVYYIEHDGEGVHYLAPSFGEYLERITALYFVGKENWHFEAFLAEKGLDPTSKKAIRWKKWFEEYINQK